MKNKAEELSCKVTLFNGARKLKGINKQGRVRKRKVSVSICERLYDDGGNM